MKKIRSISIVDYKVAQADFFLQQIESSGYDVFAALYNCDAFVSASRSITFSIQVVCDGIPGFHEWYKKEQELMKKCSLCRFFNEFRRISIHIGESPIQEAFTDPINLDKMLYIFVPTPDLPNVPKENVLEACTQYFKKCVDLVFHLYTQFRYELDERWYLTEEHFQHQDLSIEDAEELLGFPRGWTEINSSEDQLSKRWKIIRQTQAVEPAIQNIFEKYLGKIVAGPDDIN